jgi:hypothetical protein
VHVSYTVGTNGRVVPGSVAIVKSSHPRFADAVSRSVTGWMLPRALGAERPISRQQNEIFEFMLHGGPGGPIHVVRVDSTPDGILRTVIGDAAPDPKAPAAFSADSIAGIRQYAILSLAKSYFPPQESLCIAVNAGTRPARFVAADSRTHRLLTEAGWSEITGPASPAKGCPDDPLVHRIEVTSTTVWYRNLVYLYAHLRGLRMLNVAGSGGLLGVPVRCEWRPDRPRDELLTCKTAF